MIDPCDPDDDGDGIPDECDVDTTGGADCDQDGQDDSCQVDSDQDGVIDPCDPDDDNDDIPDECDVDTTGGSDCDANGEDDFPTIHTRHQGDDCDTNDMPVRQLESSILAILMMTTTAMNAMSTPLAVQTVMPTVKDDDPSILATATVFQHHR